MKSKRGIVFITIIMVLLIVIMALLINHLICRDGDAPKFLLKIDSKVVGAYTQVSTAFQKAFDYIKYLYLKVTAIQTPEYPTEHLPLYPDSRVMQYGFDKKSNTLNISSGTNDSFDAVYSRYSSLFENDISVDYFKQYKRENNYLAYGMIGNFIFLIEIVPSENEKYAYEIKTQLHYLVGEDLDMENFFRKQKGTNAYIYSNPYIYMYQKLGDKENIYLQLRDYKSQLLDLDTHVELYIDNEFYASRYYGDTIIVPIAKINEMHSIKMISFDNNNCIRAIDMLDNTLFYDATGQKDFYDLASYHNEAKNLFILNSDDIEDISYLVYFTELESLYLKGNDKTENYTTLLSLRNLSKLYLNGVNDEVIYRLSVLNNLEVLEITNSLMDINLGENFVDVPCTELEINNCPNLTFDEYGLFSVQLERLKITQNYSLNSIGFISVYPNLHIVELSECDGLHTLLNTVNLPNLNMISVDNCQRFDLSQPLENMPSLMVAEFTNNINFARTGDRYIHSIWANESLIVYKIANCGNTNEIYYSGRPWEGIN